MIEDLARIKEQLLSFTLSITRVLSKKYLLNTNVCIKLILNNQLIRREIKSLRSSHDKVNLVMTPMGDSVNGVVKNPSFLVVVA